MRNQNSNNPQTLANLPQTLDELIRIEWRGCVQWGKRSDAFSAAKQNIMTQIINFQNLVSNFENEVRNSNADSSKQQFIRNLFTIPQFCLNSILIY